MKIRRSDYSKLSPFERKRRKASVKKAYRAANRERLNALRKELRDERKRGENADWVSRHDVMVKKRLTAEERLAAHIDMQKQWLASRVSPPVIPRDRVESQAERTKRLQKEWQDRNREAFLGTQRRWREKNRSLMTERKNVWDEAHPEIAAARHAARDAVRTGYLIRQPCVVCGSTEQIEGHHPDYSKPLEVVWLCAPCHRDEHVRLRKRENAKPLDGEGLFD